jgi:hypothetical protein
MAFKKNHEKRKKKPAQRESSGYQDHNLKLASNRKYMKPPNTAGLES